MLPIKSLGSEIYQDYTILELLLGRIYCVLAVAFFILEGWSYYQIFFREQGFE
jgi:hypothetical protein